MVEPCKHGHTRGRDRFGHCRDCKVVAQRKYIANGGRALVRRANLRSKWGSEDVYDKLYASQGGVCAICGQPERSNKTKHLSVDHDHTSGRVRGLLCQRCNAAIGMLDDSPAILRAAAAYLSR